MKKILLCLTLVGCYVEPVDPGPGPGPSGLGYYECDTFVQCGDGRYTNTLYTGCSTSASAAANETVNQCVADYTYTCAGYGVYCSTTCYGGSLACRADQEDLVEVSEGVLEL